MKINKSSALTAFVVSVAFGLVGPIAALAAGPLPVNLGTAGNFAILAKTGISSTGATSVTGDLGLSPAAASYITGFGLTADPSNTFSTSALVNGDIYASDYTPPTPATMTTAVSDMEAAYTDAAGRTNPTAIELSGGNIGGMTLAPGIYKWSTDLDIPTDVTLSGGANDVWIFQVAQNLIMSSATHIILSGGAQASNVFWQVAGQTTIGTTSVFNGTILDQTTIVLNTGAQLNGRALAQAAVTLDSNIVNATASTATPVAVATPVVTTPTPAPYYAPTITYTPAPIQTQVAPASSTGNTALQTQLNGLLSELQSLQTRAGQQNSSAATSVSGQPVKTLTVNLGQGSNGSSVMTLQQFLIAQNKGPSAQTLAGVGATGTFGALTRAALAEFQASVGISPALGNFGAITRAYINANY